MATVDIMPKCEMCNGTGSRELTKVERRVWNALAGFWMTTSQVLTSIQKKERPIRSALSNMLVKLELLGLVELDDSKRESAWRRRS